MIYKNYSAQSRRTRGTFAVFACLAPSLPSSANSSVLIVPVLGVGVVDPTVGLGLSHRPGPSAHSMPLALTIEAKAHDSDRANKFNLVTFVGIIGGLLATEGSGWIECKLETASTTVPPQGEVT